MLPIFCYVSLLIQGKLLHFKFINIKEKEKKKNNDDDGIFKIVFVVFIYFYKRNRNKFLEIRDNDKIHINIIPIYFNTKI